MSLFEDIQNSLYEEAKIKNRFDNLYELVCNPEVIIEAWKRVAKNYGAAGIDNITVKDIESNGLAKFLANLQKELTFKNYKASMLRRVFIPKDNGKLRALAIPTVKDRIVQQAVRLIIEPIFEADFKDFSYGYRANRSIKLASKAICQYLNMGLTNVIDADIESFFDNINHDKLLVFIKERIGDEYIISLIKEWLRAGITYKDMIINPEKGIPQGAPISPLLANIYLNRLDTWWLDLGMDRTYNAKLIRYADDFVILTDNDAEYIMNILVMLLSELDLKLNEEKTKIVTADQGFEFLGFVFKGNKLDNASYYYPSRSASLFKDRLKDNNIISKKDKSFKDRLIRFILG